MAFFRAIGDNYTTVNQIAEALREEGVSKCGLIFGMSITLGPLPKQS